MAPEVHDIPALQRQLENVEDNDEEAHKLYNNLGVAYAAARQYRAALSAHRLEKRACRRLSNLQPGHAGRLIDLAIAYRRCGDTMLRLNGLQDAKGKVIKDRKTVLAFAHEQHVKGLQVARDADPTLPASRVEVQAACAAVAQSALQYGQETGDHADIKRACGFIAKAATLADGLGPSDRVSTKKKRVMLLSAAVNFGIALSALGDRRRAKAMLEAAAVRAKVWGDTANHARAVANLADEASLAKDWETCEKYVNLWLAYATNTRDEAEESDALQRLGVALFEQYRITEARDAFQRALLLAKEDTAKKEARKNLLLVENEIEEVTEAAEKLKVIEEELSQFASEEKYVEEAKMLISAGELAFRLRKNAVVIMHLERYFDLVDNYSCDPEVTGVAKPNHFTAVANLAEAFWLMNNYPKAVHWATRELTSYGDDIGGQAQAWCNLGVYLSDSGKKEEALEALNRSIELAKIAGDFDIAKRAECNIDILEESEKSPSSAEVAQLVPNACTNAGVNVEDYTPAETLGDAAALLPRFSQGANANRSPPSNPTSGVELENRKNVRQLRGANSRSHHVNDVVDLTDDGHTVPRTASRQNSIVVTSGEHGEDQRYSPFLPTFAINPSGMRSIRHDTNAASSAAYSYSKPQETRENLSRSNFSRGWSGADRSSAGVRRYVDVASVYKKLCMSDSRRPLNARQGILKVLRGASASVLTSAEVENGTECVSIDFAGCFIGDRELAYLFNALAAFGNFKPIFLNLGQNPLLSDAGYRCFAGQVRMSSCANIRVLNLSCAGMDSKALKFIADATQSGRGLGQVKELCLSKNGLGRHAIASAEACAVLLLSDSCLESVDLSFNLFSTTFFTKLVGAMKLRKECSSTGIGGTTLKHVNFKLNNRRNPTAMLEFDKGTDAAECVKELMKLLPAIQSMDVRSCGASFHVRQALYSFAREADCVNKIIIVSPGIFDDAAT